MRKALNACVHFLLFCFLLAVSGFLLAMPHLPLLRMKLIQFLTFDFAKMTWIGLPLLGFSFLWLSLFYVLHGGRYFVLKSRVAVDLHLVQELIEGCFVKHFPHQIALRDVEIRGKDRLDIQVVLLHASEQKELLQEAEKQLNLLFKEQLGYYKPYHLNVYE